MRAPNTTSCSHLHNDLRHRFRETKSCTNDAACSGITITFPLTVATAVTITRANTIAVAQGQD